MKKLIALFLAMTLTAAAATPQMNLVLPVVGVTQGPQWATLINNAFTLIDSHNHTTGNGSRVPVAGLNINADLGLSGFNLASVLSTRYQNQTAALAGAGDVRSTYVVNGDLFYNNASGVAVQITSGTGINIASLGTIGGDYGGSNPAAVNFSEATSTYSFLESPGIVGRMGFGPFTVFNESLASSGVTITAAPSFSSYTMALPNSAPVDNTVIKGASSGQLSFGQVVEGEIASSVAGAGLVGANGVPLAVNPDNSTLEVVTDAVQIKDLGVTTAKLADGAVTQAKREALNIITTPSSGSFINSSGTPTAVTNLSATITTTGRPVMVQMVSASTASSGTPGSVSCDAGAAVVCAPIVFFNLDGSTIASETLGGGNNGGANFQTFVPCSGFSHIDQTATAGVHTYSILAVKSTATNSVGVQDCKLVVYEL